MQNSKNVNKKHSAEALAKPNEPDTIKKTNRGAKAGKSLTGHSLHSLTINKAQAQLNSNTNVLKRRHVKNSLSSQKVTESQGGERRVAVESYEVQHETMQEVSRPQFSDEKKQKRQSPTKDIRAKLLEKNKQINQFMAGRQRYLQQKTKEWYISSQPASAVKKHISDINSQLRHASINDKEPTRELSDGREQAAASRDGPPDEGPNQDKRHHRENSVPVPKAQKFHVSQEAKKNSKPMVVQEDFEYSPESPFI